MEQAPWMALAWSETGQREVPGAAHNPRIVAYYRDAGHGEISRDEVPWCAAFVGACLVRSGQQPSGSLMARSYLDWGAALTEPRLGAVAVLSRSGDPALGHVGFIVGWTTDALYLLGGNQGDAVDVSAFDDDRLLGLRWPTESGAARALPATLPPDDSPTDEADANLFDLALEHVLEIEGGFTDDPYDPGGPTNRGITLATYARFKQVHLDAANLAELREALRSIPDAEVRSIYRSRYWSPSRAAALPPPLALMHFDAGVNHGLGAAARVLQEAVGAEIDGEIGPLTLAAARGVDPAQALAAYADIRRRRYRSLPHFWRFGRGWLARVDRTHARASSLRGADAKAPTASTRKEIDMPDRHDTTANGAPDPRTDVKWWGHSLTIWGALTTALTTVLPILGPLLGIDLTAEMVRQIGQQFVLVIQAAGGLIGTAMTIYGRIRASSRIERRPVRLSL